MNPERLGCAGSRYPVNGRKQSLRDVAAELETRGHLNERGKRYSSGRRPTGYELATTGRGPDRCLQRSGVAHVRIRRVNGRGGRRRVDFAGNK
jgi:hypothetical protein